MRSGWGRAAAWTALVCGIASSAAAQQPTVVLHGPEPPITVPENERGVTPQARQLVEAIVAKYRTARTFSVVQSYIHDLSCSGPNVSRVDFKGPDQFRRTDIGSFVVPSGPIQLKPDGFVTYKASEAVPLELRRLLLDAEGWKAALLSADSLRVENAPLYGKDRERLVGVVKGRPFYLVVGKTDRLIYLARIEGATTTYDTIRLNPSLTETSFTYTPPKMTITSVAPEPSLQNTPKP
jgi:hypothetical protein